MKLIILALTTFHNIHWRQLLQESNINYKIYLRIAERIFLNKYLFRINMLHCPWDFDHRGHLNNRIYQH